MDTVSDLPKWSIDLAYGHQAALRLGKIHLLSQTPKSSTSAHKSELLVSSDAKEIVHLKLLTAKIVEKRYPMHPSGHSWGTSYLVQ